MPVTERAAGDRERLDEMIRAEKDAKQRDRLPIVRLVSNGEAKLRIIELPGAGKATFERWVYAAEPRGSPGSVRSR